MSPKNLLRSKACRSNLSEFDDVQGHPGFDKQGTRFKRLIKDRNDHSTVEEGIRRLVLCSGKVCGGHINQVFVQFHLVDFITNVFELLQFNIVPGFAYFPSTLFLTKETDSPAGLL